MKGKVSNMAEYNGWKNWETWNINLMYGDIFCEQAQEMFDNLDYSIVFSQGIEQLKMIFCKQLSNVMKSTIEDDAFEFIGKRTDSIFCSIILESISIVDFYDIASNLWDTIDQSKLEEFKQEQEQE